MTQNEWVVYNRARDLWLAAAAVSRAETMIVVTFGARIVHARGFAGWMS